MIWVASRVAAAPFLSRFAGEGLSGGASGEWQLEGGSRVPGLGVESDEELSGEGDAHDLSRLSGVEELLSEGDVVGLVSSDDAGDDVEQAADGGAAAADGAPSGVLAGVVGERGQAAKLCDLLAGDGPDLRQLGHQQRHGAIGDPLGPTEGAVELAPERVGLEQLGDLALQAPDLGGHDMQDLGEGGQHSGVADQAPWGRCGYWQSGELAQPDDQGGQPFLLGRGRRLGLDTPGVGVPSDHPGIDPVGLLQVAHRIGATTPLQQLDP